MRATPGPAVAKGKSLALFLKSTRQKGRKSEDRFGTDYDTEIIFFIDETSSRGEKIHGLH